MSNQKYISSIVNKYGDTENLKQDIKTLSDIIDRQGSDLLIDVIAENAGNTANKFKLSPSDRTMTMIALVDSLENSLKERL